MTGPADTDNGGDRHSDHRTTRRRPFGRGVPRRAFGPARDRDGAFCRPRLGRSERFPVTTPGTGGSLTVLCPAVLDTRTLARLSERLLVVTGDRGPGARRVQAGLSELPQGTAV